MPKDQSNRSKGNKANGAQRRQRGDNAKSRRRNHRRGRVTQLFALVFASALGLTLLSGFAMVLMSWFGNDTEAMRAATANCADVFKMGVAAVLGLIGGKAIAK